MPKGRLYGVSVGPGDPELMTLKALRIIREADIIAVPSTDDSAGTAYAIAKPYLASKEIITCPTPMTRNQQRMAQAHEQTADRLCALLDEGNNIAYLCLGDIAIYSSYIYVHDIVASRGYETHIIPGVTSYSAAAARLGIALCTGSERLLVTPATDDLDEVLDLTATKVIMKPGRTIDGLRESLRKHGQIDQACMVLRCGFPDERIYENLEEADNLGYFSLVIVRDKD